MTIVRFFGIQVSLGQKSKSQTVIPLFCLAVPANLKCIFSGIKLDHPQRFGGLKLVSSPALMHGDTQQDRWFFPIGIISKEYKPYFPGPNPLVNMTDIQLYVKKDC